MEDEPKFSQFRRVIFELHEKRVRITLLMIRPLTLFLRSLQKEVSTLKSELDVIFGERTAFRTEAQQLKEEVDSLRKQLKVSLSTINLQEESKAAIAAAPNKVHVHLLVTLFTIVFFNVI